MSTTFTSPAAERLRRLRARDTSEDGPGMNGYTATTRPLSTSLSNHSVSDSNGAPSTSPVLSSKREARESFLYNTSSVPMTTPKFDPSAMRGSSTADRDRDKEKLEPNGGLAPRSGGTTRAGAPAPPPSHTASASSIGSHKENERYVGFANLPNQVYRKAVKRGFEFTLMVCGESGLGKSTLINSMFLTDLYSSDHPGPSLRTQKTVKVETNQVVLKESGVQLRLTVVDTPGFGDSVDNSNCWQPLIDSIESRYEEYLNCESRVHRKTSADNRIHCCLYFISPNGHGLKSLDIEFMKRLHDKVNIIPLIAKSDALTPDECREFKKTILNEIAQHKIKIYDFPDCDDEEDNRAQKKLKDRVPFAIVGSNMTKEVQGRAVRCRQYPWGVVEVENLEHNDFIALRNMLIRTHMQDLKDVTNNVHYENYRYNKLASVAPDGKKLEPNAKSPLAQMEEEKRDHMNKMKKMEAEMEQVFEMKVKEKKQKLKDSEADLARRSEQMKRSLDQQEKELEERRAALQRERAQWEEAQQQLQETQRRTLENSTSDLKKERKKMHLF